MGRDIMEDLDADCKVRVC